MRITCTTHSQWNHKRHPSLSSWATIGGICIIIIQMLIRCVASCTYCAYVLLWDVWIVLQAKHTNLRIRNLHEWGATCARSTAHPKIGRHHLYYCDVPRMKLRHVKRGHYDRWGRRDSWGRRNSGGWILRLTSDRNVTIWVGGGRLTSGGTGIGILDFNSEVCRDLWFGVLVSGNWSPDGWLVTGRLYSVSWRLGIQSFLAIFVTSYVRWNVATSRGASYVRRSSGGGRRDSSGLIAQPWAAGPGVSLRISFVHVTAFCTLASPEFAMFAFCTLASPDLEYTRYVLAECQLLANEPQIENPGTCYQKHWPKLHRIVEWLGRNIFPW